MKLHWDSIQKIAKAHHLEDPTGSTENFARFLKWWWCRTYNRPMKDPLLSSYNLNELCYEFLRYYYLNPDNDPKKDLETKKVKDEEDSWIKEQMARMASQAKLKAPESQVDAPKVVEEQLQAMADLPEISTKFET